jgi:WD40 repeat protein
MCLYILPKKKKKKKKKKKLKTPSKSPPFSPRYLALSPSGETIVTGAGDETLRFFNIWPRVKGGGGGGGGILESPFASIR